MLVPKSDGTVKLVLTPDQMEAVGKTVGIVRVGSNEFSELKHCNRKLAEFHDALKANGGEYDPNPPNTPTE